MAQGGTPGKPGSGGSGNTNVHTKKSPWLNSKRGRLTTQLLLKNTPRTITSS